MNTLLHGTTVALRKGRAWRAVLLRGPSGSGKSDLALRLIDQGARLIADDQTRLARKGHALLASAPTVLKNKIEVRGLGIVTLDRGRTLAAAPLALLVDLVAPDKVERMPELARETVLGIAVPVLALAAFEASTAAKIRLAVK
ncbi:MAG TPA: HPr kinase/phosphatase C-terminal domain-containing protein [Reyranellaceae bacterium]|nr:HPr kinase/phosphatase C-terminal domain-containing protein [Reyranellaceae bacterium]